MVDLQNYNNSFQILKAGWQFFDFSKLKSRDKKSSTIPIKNKPTYYSIDNKRVINTHVVLEGFEPSQAEPESDVLPLHHRTRSFFYCDAKVQLFSFPMKF